MDVCVLDDCGWHTRKLHYPNTKRNWWWCWGDVHHDCHSYHFKFHFSNLHGQKAEAKRREKFKLGHYPKNGRALIWIFPQTQ